MRLITVLLFSFLVLSLLVFTSCERTALPMQQLCEQEGGEWTTFPNSCADLCEYARNPDTTMCAQVVTESCDCGSGNCWNGTTCQPI